MNRFGITGLGLLLPALVGAVLAGGVAAQSTAPIRTVPPGPDWSALSPLALDSGNRAGFQIVPAAAMSQQDQDLLAQSEPALRREAQFLNIGFNRSQWTHVQLACPSFPNHLLMRFERNSGKGDLSAFSAAIPRNSGGKVRVLPVLHRSYSLFSPAPRNARTIAIFNRLLSEEKTARKPDWVSLASCYAAFAGQQAEAGSAPPSWSVAMQPTLHLDPDGRAFVRIVTLEPHPRRWDLAFAANGRLVAAKSSVEYSAPLRLVPAGDYTADSVVPEDTPQPADIQ